MIANQRSRQPDGDAGQTGPRRVTLPLRCAWCGLIRVGGQWLAERRNQGAALCSHGICPRCVAENFPQFRAPGRTGAGEAR